MAVIRFTLYSVATNTVINEQPDEKVLKRGCHFRLTIPTRLEIIIFFILVGEYLRA